MHYVQRIHKKANKEMVMLRTLVKNIKHSAFRSQRGKKNTTTAMLKKKLTAGLKIFSPLTLILIYPNKIFMWYLKELIKHML